MINFNIDLDNLFLEAQASNPDLTAASDVSKFVGNLFLNVSVGASNNDTPSFTVEHSADNSTFTAIPASALFDPATGDAATFTDAVAATASDQTLGLVRQQLKRYVRVSIAGAVSSARTISVTMAGQYQYTEVA